MDPFTGEDPEIHLEDWLPSLERAAAYNGWEPDELLFQLARHLRGRALLEWNLLGATGRATFETAVGSLQTRLDPGGRAMAA